MLNQNRITGQSTALQVRNTMTQKQLPKAINSQNFESKILRITSSANSQIQPEKGEELASHLARRLHPRNPDYVGQVITNLLPRTMTGQAREGEEDACGEKNRGRGYRQDIKGATPQL